MSTDKDALIFVLSKEQVRQRKLAHLLKTFGPSVLPEGPALAIMMGSFQFLVDGWNDDPNELYSIPEIRKFYQTLHQVWPYWFFFCDLHTETLQMMTLCLLPNLKGFKRVGEPKAAVEYDPMDLLRFIEKNLHSAQHDDGTRRHERDGYLQPDTERFPLLRTALRRARSGGMSWILEPPHALLSAANSSFQT